VVVDTNDLEVSESSDNSESENNDSQNDNKNNKVDQENIYKEIIKININNQENRIRNFPLKKKDANWFQ